MAKVTNLKISIQSGSENTYYASWDFNENYMSGSTAPPSTGGGSSSSSTVRNNTWVRVKSGAKWYNGVTIDSWVFNEEWYVIELKGTRAVINQNRKGDHRICSPIHIDNLIPASTTARTMMTRASTKTLDHYEVKWWYDSGNGIWFSGQSGNVTDKNATYSPPNNARRIKVSVTPVAKTRKVNNVDTKYWSGTATTKDYNLSYSPPEVPPMPTVEIDKYKLTATVKNVSDPKTDQIEFELYNGTKLMQTGAANVITCMASYAYTVSSGGKYRVRCRAVNIVSTSKVYSNWTNFTEELETIPSGVTNVVCAADSETSVKVTWNASDTAKSYNIEYTTNKNYFDSSTSVSSMTVESTTAYVTGLESGKPWFFRVRSVNDKGQSGWSNIVSTIIGTTPTAPTTWSSTVRGIIGETINLYWVHNSEDNSSETYAELELTINGAVETHKIKKSTDKDEKDKTSVYTLSTIQYKEGTKILWRVRTSGATQVFGKWSIKRTIDIYAPPTLTLSMTNVDADNVNVVTEFPFYISALAGPKTQAAIGYHLSISANETYETRDQIGNITVINAGQEIYSKYFDISEALMVEFSASNIDLENNKSYTVLCVVSMNSGLTAQAKKIFSVSWKDAIYEPNAEIGVDKSSYSAYIKPYCIDANGKSIEDVTLTVYRREFDGSFTEIARDLSNTNNVYVTDPHPALDYARYRIVAISISTGAVSFYDPPGYPIQCTSAIIQWEEQWSKLEYPTDDVQEKPTWSGSLLELPYNIDVSEATALDKTLVEYVGRKHPVSYYGTQQGTTQSWNAEIPKEDRETIYALRRLSVWAGDVYIREPYGSGYWANVDVSFNQNHNSLTVPIRINITRVEGGI